MMVPSLASGTAATTTAETKAAAEPTSLSWRKLMRIRAFSRVRLEISGSSFSKFSGATTAARGTGGGNHCCDLDLSFGYGMVFEVKREREREREGWEAKGDVAG
ncbi:hypothetical protein GBA52_016964 [Prunus armeniaca]|nr:hypothetical protein GBA52_016964 [Prunus armeniaca]